MGDELRDKPAIDRSRAAPLDRVDPSDRAGAGRSEGTTDDGIGPPASDTNDGIGPVDSRDNGMGPERADAGFGLGVKEPWSQSLDNPTPSRYRLDPTQQAKFEAAVAEKGLTPETAAMINEGWQYDGGRQVNCGECARAVASTIEGEPRVAAAYDPPPGSLEPVGYTEKWTGKDFSPTMTSDAPRGFDNLEAEIRNAGPGSHAIVIMKGKAGHAYNIWNRNGEVTYVDAQVPPHFFAPDSPIARDRRSAQWMAWARIR